METKEITKEQALKLAAIMIKNSARIGVPKIVKK
jgi:hypothetical protein